MKRDKYTPQLRAQMADGFIRASDKGAYAKRTGIAIGTLYHWAKGRRAPARPHPRVAPSRSATTVTALPAAPPFDPGQWPAVLSAFEAVAVAIDGLAPAVADAVLRTHLYRLHIPGLSTSPAAEVEREASA
jgi:hypothetical protein